MPLTTRRILSVVQKSLTLFLGKPGVAPSPDARSLVEVAKFLSVLRDEVSCNSPTPLFTAAFYNQAYTDLVPFDACQDQTWPILQYQAILTLRCKHAMFLESLDRMRRNAWEAVYHRVRQEMLSQGGLSTAPNDMDSLMDRRGYFRLAVRRADLVEDSIQLIPSEPDGHLHLPLSVRFAGEDAIDAGGVTREYFHTLIGQAFSADFGLFEVIRTRLHWFNPCQPHVEKEATRLYRTLGTIVALAVYSRVVLPIRFPLLLYKKLLGKAITIWDLAEVHPDIFDSLQELKKAKETGDDVSEIGTTFSISQRSYGADRTIPLIVNGENIPVDNANCGKYIQKIVKWYTTKSIRGAFLAFASGFGRVFPPTTLMGFAPDEMDIVISGEDVFDWAAFQRGAAYRGEGDARSATVRLFWEVFAEMSHEQKRMLLRFTTGSDMVPYGGLGKLPFVIEIHRGTDCLPYSHTCSSTFVLPIYASKAEMKRKILFAIQETEGFGMK